MTRLVNCNRYNFNPRTHVGVRHIRHELHNDVNKYFNPRTHVGVRRCIQQYLRYSQHISIHALTQECDAVSCIPLSCCLRLFQSTHSRRSATLQLQQCICITYFNPRTHVGVRHELRSIDSANRYFNPRTHVGVRPQYSTVQRFDNDYFNPRTHVGVRRRLYRVSSTMM